MTRVFLDRLHAPLHHKTAMGLYQDQTNSLSEIKRLAALVTDPSRRNEIGDDQWPLAMIAYGLVQSNNDDPSQLREGLDIYHIFQNKCTPEARTRCMLQLGEFIRQRQGNGWKSLILFALGDTLSPIRKNAAFLIATLAPSTPDERFPGIAELCRIVTAKPMDKQQDALPIFDALLSLADLRFTPYLDSIRQHASINQLESLISQSEATPNALSCKWMIDTLKTYPEMANSIAAALEKMAPRANEIMDVIIPIPSWQFKAEGIQALHGWTRPEFFARMKPDLTPLLTEQALHQITHSWC